MFMAAALVTVLIAVPALNTSIFNDQIVVKEQSGGRDLASVDRRATADRQRVESELIKRLAGVKDALGVHVGVKPSAEDAFRYEGLEGKYVIEFHEGKLVTAAVRGGEAEGTIVRDDLDFLSKYAEVFSPSAKFASRRVSERVDGPIKTVAYELTHRDPTTRGQKTLVELEKTQADRLLHIRVRPAAQ
jgi:hypothetical protein